MFNLLKNKVSEFLAKLTKKEEEKDKKQLKEEKEVKEKQEINLMAEDEEEKFKKEEKEKEIIKEDTKKIEKSDEIKKDKKEINDFEKKDWEKIEKAAFKNKKELTPKVGIVKKITTIFEEEIKIEKKDIEELLAELEVSLLEADVAYEVSKEIVGELEK
ncbi:MAG: signal recognition particle receptor subunit alpha, partial [Candidatus Anstonellaceae archaeon]